jgi:2'-5' RNA ligase
MTKTITNRDIKKPVVGYMLNTPLSPENQQKIVALQKQLDEKFGSAIWNAPKESLHITLFDWLAPLVEYTQDKDKLFDQIFDEYDQVVSNAVKGIGPITVTFDVVDASPGAVFMKGHDSGQYEAIRQHYLDNIELLPNTKRPPNIIHITVARFQEAVDLEPIQEFLAQTKISFTQEVNSFRLVKETLDPMLDFKTIKEYKLGI